MVDLHTHTTHSDGRLTPKELLELANSSGISVLSITDHNSVGAYKEVGDTFKGKLVTGVELNAYLGPKYVEVLGYGFDVAKMEKEIERYTLENTIQKSQQIAQEAFDRCGLGIKLEASDMNRNGFLECTVVFRKHTDKIKSLYPHVENGEQLFRRELTNPKSKLFTDLSSLYPTHEEAVDIVRRCGGLAFLAHPYNCIDPDAVLEYAKNIVDGIECFHYTATPEQSEYLLDFCKRNNLFTSRGSDFHRVGLRHLGYLCTPEVPSWLQALLVTQTPLCCNSLRFVVT